MANTYLYGAYGHLGETIAKRRQAGTVPFILARPRLTLYVILRT